MACRWGTTACRRSCRAASRAASKPPRLVVAMGKRARRRGDTSEESPASATDGDGATEVDGDGGAPASPPQKGGAPQGDIRLRQAMDHVEEADHLLALFRWTLLTGEVPRPEDWLPREDWPHPDQVGHVFGSWNRFIEYSGLRDAPPVLRKRAQDEREQRLEGRAKQLDREEKRAADLRRQLDVARRRRAEAEALRDEHDRRVAGLEQRLGAAEKRAQEATGRLAERRESAEQAAAGHAAVDDDWLRAHEATLAELEQVRAHRDELLRRSEEQEAELARQRQSIAELSALLGSVGDEAEAVAGDDT